MYNFTREREWWRTSAIDQISSSWWWWWSSRINYISDDEFDDLSTGSRLARCIKCDFTSSLDCDGFHGQSLSDYNLIIRLSTAKETHYGTKQNNISRLVEFWRGKRTSSKRWRFFSQIFFYHSLSNIMWRQTLLSFSFLFKNLFNDSHPVSTLSRRHTQHRHFSLFLLFFLSSSILPLLSFCSVRLDFIIIFFQVSRSVLLLASISFFVDVESWTRHGGENSNYHKNFRPLIWMWFLALLAGCCSATLLCRVYDVIFLLIFHSHRA